MNLVKKKKKSVTMSSIKLAFSRPEKTGLMILFDLSFLISFFYLLPILARNFGEIFLLPFAASASSLYIYVVFIFSTIYYLLVLFVYSFFKFCVLDFIKSMYSRDNFSFRRLGKFYMMNAAILIPAYLLFSLILASVKPAYQPFVFVIAGIPLAFVLYVVVNMSQNFFYRGKSAKASVRKSFSVFFNKAGTYAEIIFAIILLFAVIGIVMFGIGYLIRAIGSSNYTFYLSLYSYYTTITLWLAYVFFYLAILINRLSFYKITEE